jgi:thiol-disulfide isomerase/thioredoxin
MATEILTRSLIALAIVGVGVGVFSLANRVILKRASQKFQGLESFNLGVPAILYFTTPTCVPCKIVQRPAIQEVQEVLGAGVQIIEVDASLRTDLADYWGVLSVPTTFIIDPEGKPRQINHGVTLANKLIAQINNIRVEKAK